MPVSGSVDVMPPETNTVLHLTAVKVTACRTKRNKTLQRCSLDATRAAPLFRGDVPGAPPGAHDFDIKLCDGRVIALEVTAAADEAFLNLWAAISKSRGCWSSARLASSWAVCLRADTALRVKPIARQLEGLLVALEDIGCRGFEQVRPGEFEVVGFGLNPPVAIH